MDVSSQLWKNALFFLGNVSAQAVSDTFCQTLNSYLSLWLLQHNSQEQEGDQAKHVWRLKKKDRGSYAAMYRCCMSLSCLSSSILTLQKVKCIFTISVAKPFTVCISNTVIPLQHVVVRRWNDQIAFRKYIKICLLVSCPVIYRFSWRYTSHVVQKEKSGREFLKSHKIQCLWVTPAGSSPLKVPSSSPWHPITPSPHPQTASWASLPASVQITGHLCCWCCF